MFELIKKEEQALELPEKDLAAAGENAEQIKKTGEPAKRFAPEKPSKPERWNNWAKILRN